ncbi:MAG: hypothetical protein RLZZ500_2530 [Bacteroidota bacterium]|jgi:biopolymer transport protein ExbD
MRKIIFLSIVAVFTACSQKEVLLPEAQVTVVKNVDNLSPVYIFFEQEGNDTIADLNRKNTITSTNYIFNIDKRLPMRLVVPEVNFVLKKKEASPHKSETAQNYFSYSDTKARNLAFLNMQLVHFKEGKYKGNVPVLVSKNGDIQIKGQPIAKDKVMAYLAQLPTDKPIQAQFQFDSGMTYGDYLTFRIAVSQWKFPALGATWFTEDWFSNK